jgi:Fic family protein
VKILTDIYLAEYKKRLPNLASALQNIAVIEDTPHNFTFYTSIAVISSARIEGEQLELDSYVKHKMQDIEYLPGLVEKPNDLFKAYQFAQKHELTLQNFLNAHSILAEHLLPAKWRGVWRQNQMLVMEHKTGRIQFEAAPFEIIQKEMDKLWQDIDYLNTQKLIAEEVLYYASFIHLAFVCIHPFNDGNGRAGRLLEKWFLARHLGEKAWYIKSEKYYYDHVNDYYKNLNRLGVFYDQLDYSKAQPFLQMLPRALSWEQ